MTAQDPGWKLAARSLPTLFVRRFGLRRSRPPSGTNRLVELRARFLGLAASIVAIAAFVIVIGDPPNRSRPASLSVAIVVAVGVVSLIVQRLCVPEVDGTSPDTLAARYTTRFLLRIAFCDAPALGGLVVALSLGPWWVYFVGAGFTAIGLVMIAPTAANLARDRHHLASRGRALVLLDALCPEP